MRAKRGAACLPRTLPLMDVIHVTVVSHRPLIRAGLRMVLGFSQPPAAISFSLINDATPDVIVFDVVGADEAVTQNVREVAAGARVPVLAIVPDMPESASLPLVDETWGVFPLGSSGSTIRAMVNSAVTRRATGPSIDAHLRREGVGDGEHRYPGPARRNGAVWSPRGPSPVNAMAQLSGRERQVLDRIAQGMSNQQIAQDLFLGVNSVKTYIRTGYRKIGVRTRTQAVLWVAEHPADTDAEDSRHDLR